MEIGPINLDDDADDSIEMPDPIASMAYDDLVMTPAEAIRLVNVSV